MGRIKSLMVKRATKQLLATSKNDLNFSVSFEHNKKTLGSTMPSKSTRNKIAGYMARVIRMREVEKKAVAKQKEIKESGEPIGTLQAEQF